MDKAERYEIWYGEYEPTGKTVTVAVICPPDASEIELNYRDELLDIMVQKHTEHRASITITGDTDILPRAFYVQYKYHEPASSATTVMFDTDDWPLIEKAVNKYNEVGDLTIPLSISMSITSICDAWLEERKSYCNTRHSSWHRAHSAITPPEGIVRANEPISVADCVTGQWYEVEGVWAMAISRRLCEPYEMEDASMCVQKFMVWHNEKLAFIERFMGTPCYPAKTVE